MTLRRHHVGCRRADHEPTLPPPHYQDSRYETTLHEPNDVVEIRVGEANRCQHVQ
ncbi:hypothetical protein SCLCIDRAFT_1222431 [Scleroderma citrinum Foug A]|uniref:Uncharacterized protein n=1 Tax=Scleroderma citrinum Foug A TaxID=1036808 RepID=A0A0C3CZC4_9AGAM|nr:hypothetical protein SCLCIDRAFT_1222431 [Scleroderma citrinum Foug A]